MVKGILRIIFSIFFMLMAILIFHSTKLELVKLYPVMVSFFFFCVFFLSTFQKKTIIQKFAEQSEGKLSPIIEKYTRNLTYVWSFVIFCNFVISLVTVFMSEKIWIAYNGCLSYILIGGVVIIEYFLRKRFRKKYDC